MPRAVLLMSKESVFLSLFHTRTLSRPSAYPDTTQLWNGQPNSRMDGGGGCSRSEKAMAQNGVTQQAAGVLSHAPYRCVTAVARKKHRRTATTVATVAIAADSLQSDEIEEASSGREAATTHEDEE